MQIFVKEPKGKIISIDVETSELVESLKLKIEDKTGVPSSRQELKFEYKILKNQKTLDYYDITTGSTINLILGLRGGSMGPSFGFNSMNKLEKISFSNSAPIWRGVHRGISWKGICKNQNCQANNKEVYANLGFGIFSLRKTIYNLNCPLCKTKIEDVRNCGFHKASWKFEGMDINEVLLKGEGKTKDNCYYTFQEHDDIEWLYLNITVTPL